MSGRHMSLESALRPHLLVYDYQALSRKRGLHGWDVRPKLLLLALAIAFSVVAAEMWLSVSLCLLAWALAFWSRLPARLFFLFLLAPAWAVSMVIVGFSIGFGQTVWIHIGSVALYWEGMSMGLSAAARVASDMSWMALVVLATPFTKVLAGLRWFAVPAVLVEALAFSYRYTLHLFEESCLMRDASRARGGVGDWRRSLRTTGMILGEVILRAYDRSHRIQQAMVARGSEAPPQKAPAPGSREGACPNRCDISPPSLDVSTPLVKARGLRFSYSDPSRQVIQNISIPVAAGEVVAICGPNGSGKTTLLKLLAGILESQEGEVKLSGQTLNRRNRHQAFKQVGILFQDPNDQLFCPQVREDVDYGPGNLGLPPDEIERLVDIAMELMTVSHLAQRPVHRLSHGEKKKVSLAGVIAMRPRLILLDEPSAGLDPLGARELIHLIQHLNNHHAYSFVTVTHDLNLVPLIARRMVLMDHGRTLAQGPTERILNDTELLKKARLVPPVLTQLFDQLSREDSITGGAPLTVAQAAARLRRMTHGEAK